MLQTDIAAGTGMYLSPVPEPPGDPAALSNAAIRYTAAHGQLERDRTVLASVQDQTTVPLQWTGFGAFAFGNETANIAAVYILVAAAYAQAAAALRIYAADLATAKETAREANTAISESNSLATALNNAQTTAAQQQTAVGPAEQAATTAETQAATNPHSPAARVAANQARTAATVAQTAATNAWIKVTNLAGQYNTAYRRATTLAAEAHTQATTAAAKAAAAFDAVIGPTSGHRAHPARGGATGKPGHHSSSIFSDILSGAVDVAMTVVGVGGDVLGFAADETGVGAPLGTVLEEVSTPLVEEGVSGITSIGEGEAGSGIAQSATETATSDLRNGALAGSAHPTTGVPFDENGYPDFSQWRHPDVPDVTIEPSGTRAGDFARANEASGLDSTPEGYTWHHHQDPGIMQLIERATHTATGHTGGFSIWGK